MCAGTQPLTHTTHTRTHLHKGTIANTSKGRPEPYIHNSYTAILAGEIAKYIQVYTAFLAGKITRYSVYIYGYDLLSNPKFSTLTSSYQDTLLRLTG
jgi:hypothetical protein